MNINQKTSEQQDVETLSKMIPWWASKLNWIYQHTFEPLNRFLDSFSATSTQRTIDGLEAANKTAKSRQPDMS